MAQSPAYTPDAPPAAHYTPSAQAAEEGASALPPGLNRSNQRRFSPGSRHPAVTTNAASDMLSKMIAIQKSSLAPVVDAGAQNMPPEMRARFRGEVSAPGVWGLNQSTGVVNAIAVQNQRAAAAANPRGLAETSRRKGAAHQAQMRIALDTLARHEAQADELAARARAAIARNDPAEAYQALRAATALLKAATGAGRGLFVSGAKTIREGANLGALKVLAASPNPRPVLVEATKRLLDLKLEVPYPATVGDDAVAFAASVEAGIETPSSSWVLGDVDVGSISSQAIALAAQVRAIRGDVTQQLDHVGQALSQGAGQAVRNQVRVARATFGDVDTTQLPSALPNAPWELGGFLDDLLGAGERLASQQLSNVGKATGTSVPSPGAADISTKKKPEGPSWGLIFGAAAGVALAGTGAWFALRR